MLKFVSWNVNGLRACMKKDFMQVFNKHDADFFCIQESKLQEGQIEMPLDDSWHQYWNYAEKKGYSGTAVFTKHKALNVMYGIGIEEFDDEGRVITLEYPDFYFINIYVPNSQEKLKRLDYRVEFEAAFLNYIMELDKVKPVIYCGDLNVAHKEIDLKNPANNHKNPGFSDEERACFDEVLNAGFLDSYRYFYPDKEEIYSWWSYRFSARAKNIGWRIDYFVVSDKLKDKMITADIHNEDMGSDHCPVSLEMDLN